MEQRAMIVLGISGRLKSGKDTASDFIKEALLEWKVRGSFVRLGFADAVYRELGIALCAMNMEFASESQIQYYISYVKQNKDNFRNLLQGIGTDYRRELCGRGYWVNQVLKKLTTFNNDAFVCIPDIRFLNELQPLTSVDIPVWRIVRPSLGHLPEDAHPSETELKDTDYWETIIVNEDINTYRIEVRNHLSLLLRKKYLIK